MFSSRIRPLLAAGALLLASACINENEKASPLHPSGSIETSEYDADSAKAWFDLLFASVDAEDLSAPEAARRAGYAAVTFYESVVQGMPEHRSLGEQLNGLDEVSEVPDGLIHWPSVANAAMPLVLTDLFAGAQPATLQGFLDLQATLDAQFAIDVPDQPTRDRSIEAGEDIAADILDWIADDGHDVWSNCTFTPPLGDGLWEPTPPGLGPPIEPCWGNLRPLALLFGAQCAPLPPPPFSRTAGSAFANEALEVYELNDAVDPLDNLSPEEQAIANFWADGAGTLTTPGHWLSIVGQVVDQEGLDLEEAAEAYARAGIALADSTIAAWEILYTYNELRPITYIHDPLGPINDPAWDDFVETPAFPDFTAARAAQSWATAFLLEDQLGGTSFTDDTHAGVQPARSFGDFDEAASEASEAGILGGNDFRSSVERAFDQGRCIGDAILQNVQFLK